MAQTKSNKKYIYVLTALAVLAAVLLIGALIGKNNAQKKDYTALNEVISNTSDLSAGSGVGYMLTYAEDTNEVFNKISRNLVFSKSDAGYTFLETSGNEEGTQTYNTIYGTPTEYYSKDGDNWLRQQLEDGTGIIPYSLTWAVSDVSTSQVNSIRKIDQDGKTGYRINYTTQWLKSNYHGYGTPLSGEITYILDENDGKQIITSVSQKLRARAKADGKQQVRVIEETLYLRPNELEDGQQPSEYLTQYFEETVKDHWTEAPKEEADPSAEETEKGTEGGEQPEKESEEKNDDSPAAQSEQTEEAGK